MCSTPDITKPGDVTDISDDVSWLSGRHFSHISTNATLTSGKRESVCVSSQNRFYRFCQRLKSLLGITDILFSIHLAYIPHDLSINAMASGGGVSINWAGKWFNPEWTTWPNKKIKIKTWRWDVKESPGAVRKTLVMEMMKLQNNRNKRSFVLRLCVTASAKHFTAHSCTHEHTTTWSTSQQHNTKKTACVHQKQTLSQHDKNKHWSTDTDCQTTLKLT